LRKVEQNKEKRGVGIWLEEAKPDERRKPPRTVPKRRRKKSRLSR